MDEFTKILQRQRLKQIKHIIKELIDTGLGYNNDISVNIHTQLLTLYSDLKKYFNK